MNRWNVFYLYCRIAIAKSITKIICEFPCAQKQATEMVNIFSCTVKFVEKIFGNYCISNQLAFNCIILTIIPGLIFENFRYFNNSEV